ncbi:MAG: UDP-N-acetylmuramoyl-tripeptide--D-alanyl-D-alanine ligase [Acidimicrobiia bacterium]
MELTSQWVAATTGGRVMGAPARPGEGIAFDSRAVVPGQVFVALRGERDGHEFVADAIARGAAFAIVERPVDDLPVVVVDDTATALLRLARAGRERLAARVVGITGSVGKTSTKDLTAAALRAGAATHAAPESYNNEIGVPVTVLGAPEDTAALVVEMGARFAGNIAELCALVTPEVGVITNIGLTHAEHLGGPEGVARVKGELLDALPAHGLAVVDASCLRSVSQRHRSVAPVITVGTGAESDVQVRGVTLDADLRARFELASPWGTGVVVLGVRGEHQVVNAAQAATVALHLGVPFAAVVDALATAEGSAWRMQVVDAPGGFRIINDAYNASPVATLAALRALAAHPTPGRRIAVLGEMRELGALSESEHARVGAAVAAGPFDLLIAVGEATTPLVEAARAGRPDLPVVTVADAEAARAALAAVVQAGDVVLVKASRAVGLERVVEGISGVAA